MESAPPKLLKKNFPRIKIIGLSIYDDKEHIKGMLQAGAHGYLLKTCTYKQLLEAIATVSNGNKYLSDEVTSIVVNNLVLNNEGEQEIDYLLTARENEVFYLYIEGFSTREIAEKLFVSIKTIGTHKQHILEKLQLKSVAEMIRFGYENGLIPSK